MRTFLLSIFLLVISFEISAQTNQYNYINPLSGRFSVMFEGGATYTKADFSTSEFDWLTRLNLKHTFFSSNQLTFSLRAFGGYGYLSGGDGATFRLSDAKSFSTKAIYGGFGPAVNYAVSDYVIPYAAIGLNYLNINPQLKDSSGNEISYGNRFSPHHFLLTGEAGIRFLFTRNLGMTISAGAVYVNSDNLDDIPNKLSNGTDKDMFFYGLAGFSFYFGGIEDSDNDGVPDKKDLCADTPQGVLVDEFGCPVDTDNDGVPDYLDKCPNTPRNIPVDENGCPSDADNDGVPDFRDICPDTPEEVPVDERGCPSDTDGDGVPDYRDLCPGTPIGVEVDKWGCELKPEVTTVIPETKFILSGSLNFEVGKAELLANATVELEKMFTVMKEYPDTRWRIEGHTDNTGSYELNKKLSLERANAVYIYLTSRGIDPARLKVVGMGPDNPLADNTTETGRAINRRVAIVMIDEKTEKAFVPEMKDKKTYVYNDKIEKNLGGMIFTDGRMYTVQVSSWRERHKAEAEVAKLQSAGYNTLIIEVNIPQLDGIWYRVRVGYFDNLSEAQRIRSALRDK